MLDVGCQVFSVGTLGPVRGALNLVWHLWANPDLVYRAFLYPYLAVVAVICLYGFHRWHLVYLYYRHRRNAPRLQACFLQPPRVTIQLPMYNERYVARRIIEKTCQINYPRDRLQIQVLDDSTDDTVQIARQAVEEMRAAGHDITYIHRKDRSGYKAGALEAGLKTATGELICIFDADFVPSPDILRQTINYFTEPRIGMVQARWGHINRDHSLLTKTQAILLDGHFMIEHTARNRSGRFMSFNGTAGIWRKRCIEDAGGWQHDTLTEDLDLSYRAQLKGWKFVFLPELVSPAELPPEMNAFKAQQYRWAKGGAQTCKKLLPKILRSALPWRVKIEAFFHLTSCTVYLDMVFLTVLLFPALYLKLSMFRDSVLGRVLFDSSLFLIATCSPSIFYLASQREIFHTWADKIKYLPFLMSLGIGISLNNARAALAGFFGKPSEFVRTPKFGLTTATDNTWRTRLKALQPRRKRRMQPYVELAVGLYLASCVVLCFTYQKVTIGVPFLLMFMVGYLYVSLASLWPERAGQAEPAEQPSPPAVQSAPASAGRTDPAS